MSESKVAKGCRPMTKISTGRFDGCQSFRRFDRTYLRFGNKPVFAIANNDGQVLKWVGPKAAEAAAHFMQDGDAPFVPHKSATRSES